MRILYAGTPEIAVPCLEALVQAGHAVEVLTNPDAPSGRGGRFSASPVALTAEGLGLAVHKPERLDATVRTAWEGRFDLLVSFAYGKIFGPKFLGLFPLGGLNVHPSLLPRWRGPSPLPAAILARDSETGISVQKLALEMDSGDLVVQTRRKLDGTETTGSLSMWAADAAVEPLLEAVSGIAAGTARPRPQDPAGTTYCRLLQKSDGELDWSRSADELDAVVRAYHPWPGAYTVWNGVKLLIQASVPRPGQSGNPTGTVVSVDTANGILVQTKEGLLAVRQLQLPSRKSLDFRNFLNGNPDLIGSRLGDAS